MGRDRLAEALRANLQKRKGQARARRAGATDGREGIAPAGGDTEDGGEATGGGERD